jgi:hypothetical protein
VTDKQKVSLVGLGVALLVIALFVSAFLWHKVSCENRWRHSGYEVRFEVVAGCLLKKGDKWLPSSTIREIL